MKNGATKIGKLPWLKREMLVFCTHIHECILTYVNIQKEKKKKEKRTGLAYEQIDVIWISPLKISSIYICAEYICIFKIYVHLKIKMSGCTPNSFLNICGHTYFYLKSKIFINAQLWIIKTKILFFSSFHIYTFHIFFTKTISHTIHSMYHII